jgi:heptaprenyl diphosphate synthase
VSSLTSTAQSFWQAWPTVETQLAKVRSVFRQATRSPNTRIQDAIEHLLQHDGKLLRPALLLLSGAFGRSKGEKLIQLAAAIEMLHTATLVHDDVIDESPTRRGQAAAHIRYGKKDAVLIGDFLLSRSFTLCAAHSSVRNNKYLARALSWMCDMEIQQGLDTFQVTASIRSYLRKISGKTALLFSLACHTGSSEAKAPTAQVQSLRRFAYALGMAFQIQDDILDYESQEEELKKPAASDLANGLITLPFLCALQKDDGRLSSYIHNGLFSSNDAPAMLQTVKDLGGPDMARVWVDRYISRAERELYALPDIPARTILLQLLETLRGRRY